MADDRVIAKAFRAGGAAARRNKNERDLSVSYDRVGDGLVSQGNLAEALKSFRAGLEISERLAASDAANTDWRHDLAVSFSKLADVHKRSGDETKARDYSRQGKAIMARLTKLSLENAVWKQDLAWFAAQLAELGEK